MSKNSLAFNVSNCAADGSKPLQQGLQQKFRLPAAVRSPVWLGLLGALTIMGMLLTFHQVVHGAVQQSVLLHKATAVHAEATRRCNVLQAPGASESCRLQLNAALADTVSQIQTKRVAGHDGFNPLSRSQ